MFAKGTTSLNELDRRKKPTKTQKERVGEMATGEVGERKCMLECADL